MRIVLCNCGPEQAPALARALVDERLAACVNLLAGVRSVYRWEGQVHEDAETTLIIKVATETVPALSARIHALHDYDTPEIVVLAVDEATDAAYLDWVRSASKL